MVYAIFSASVLLAIGAIYVGAIGWLYFRQERLLFEPAPLPLDEPICDDEDTREFFVEVPGARLSVAQLMRPNPRGVFFFLHGNSGNLKKWFVELDAFRQANFDVVMLDYRGFGKSSGQIESEEQLRSDVVAVWHQLAPMYEGKRVVISGQSLGTGLAAGLAAQLSSEGHAPDLTLLVSPYSSMKVLAAELYPWVPLQVLRYPLHTLEHAAKLLGPVMLIHGEKDELIPIRHSETLVKSMRSAQLLRVDGAGHSDVHQFPTVRKALMSALGRL
ncbi:alpha/beta fold hydrolase [Ramlibacter ginsenosidimutans]|uniref:Alpha/beta fold hydrolase n=1 Tax=Ramlibacter ginsenosidimutans TaxID=502333 RepID=A0A934TTV6_9BURK|nr:alpha/beta fold hydrolase [Ramlibacter ginsenosidimutans]MBK6006790.1 alpha/beta fold hydrolase [Ramlibacter ginsenosidimutans]